MQHSAYKFG